MPILGFKGESWRRFPPGQGERRLTGIRFTFASVVLLFRACPGLIVRAACYTQSYLSRARRIAAAWQEREADGRRCDCGGVAAAVLPQAVASYIVRCGLCCCSHVNSHNQVRGSETGFSHSGAEEHPGKKRTNQMWCCIVHVEVYIYFELLQNQVVRPPKSYKDNREMGKGAPNVSEAHYTQKLRLRNNGSANDEQSLGLDVD